MIRKIKEQIDLPLVVGKTYPTKFATKEEFTITEIQTDKKGTVIRLMGIYSHSPELGLCPISPDRIIHQKTFSGKILEVCGDCGATLYCD